MTAKGHWRVEWGKDGASVVDSVAELDELLDTLAEQAHDTPFMAELISPTGDSLALGLGLERSALSWVSANQDPPYFASKGDSKAEGTIVFHYRGDWSEFPCWSTVPTSAARQAMREFFTTNELPSGVAWEEV